MDVILPLTFESRLSDYSMGLKLSYKTQPFFCDAYHSFFVNSKEKLLSETHIILIYSDAPKGLK